MVVSAINFVIVFAIERLLVFIAWYIGANGNGGNGKGRFKINYNNIRTSTCCNK